ncbi:MAG: acetyl-CoA carboxylase biotin carboxyl carrier protein [Acidobacteria bacterium]|nr:MAG: acetyl-CoA carboxylase biotin carboxyl carrier protein [Acidobacteriota bacterium]
MINIDDVRRILEMAREHELSELEVESEGFRIRIRKDTGGVAPLMTPPAAQPLAAAQAAPVPAAAAPVAAAAPGIEPDMELAVVTSPIVGTFYRSPEPSAPPFVQPGDTVRKGQTLCIIEAMKMMNNIDSEYDGTIVKVYVENGQPVQYGERLFAIQAR